MLRLTPASMGNTAIQVVHQVRKEETKPVRKRDTRQRTPVGVVGYVSSQNLSPIRLTTFGQTGDASPYCFSSLPDCRVGAIIPSNIVFSRWGVTFIHARPTGTPSDMRAYDRRLFEKARDREKLNPARLKRKARPNHNIGRARTQSNDVPGKAYQSRARPRPCARAEARHYGNCALRQRPLPKYNASIWSGATGRLK